jgi:peptide/nickel transport system substrate-binding protein
MATKILMILLGLTLVLLMACGSAAESTAAPDPTATQAPDTAAESEPTAAPAVAETAQPTAVPQMTDAPAEVEVNPGKLTNMVGDLANERFDPAFTSGGGSRNYGRIMNGFLVSTNEEREMLPGIAQEWNVSADGLTWTFTIREDVKFHDGSEVTPEDVQWTLQHYFGPQAVDYTVDNNAARLAGAMDTIEMNGRDVSVTTTEPVTEFGYLIAEAGDRWYHIMPKRDELHNEEAELAYDNNPIGAGPMKLAGHTRAQVMQFERFDDFYYQPANGFPEDKRVKFQSLDLFVVPEEATRVAALRSGEADIVLASLPARGQVEAGGGRMVFGPEGVTVEAMMRACYKPEYPCSDKRVRQALDYAIDKELIRDQLYGGSEVFETRGWHIITPTTVGYTPELDPRPFDPNRARQLLEEAGYPGGEGFGKLIVNTFPSASMPFQVEAAQLAADLWRRELGIDVEVRVGDSVGTRERELSGELDGQILWKENDTRIDATSGTFNKYGNPESLTRLHDDQAMFQVVQETFQILDPEEREVASQKLFLRLREENYLIGVGYVNIPWGVGPRVETWEPYPLAIYPSALHTITLK